MSGKSYSADKPENCSGCYYWQDKRKGCSLGVENCYYLISVPEQEKSECDGCPYGRNQPCIGFCLKKCMQEMKMRKKSLTKAPFGGGDDE